MEPGELTCPACGGPMAPWRTVESSEPEVGPRVFSLARCTDCGTAVTLGPEVPEAHSTGAYGGGRPRGSRVLAPVLGLFDRQRLSLVPPAPQRLVDAGAGRGRFVAAALRSGYDAVGVEPSLRAVDPLVPLLAVPLSSAVFEPGSVDVVTLWHVLEHLPDPASALAVLHGWLAVDGTLLVGVPDLGSWQSRLGGGRWYHLDLPRHRVHFSVAGVSSLLRSCGFEVVSVHHVLLEHNAFGMWQSLVSQATRRPSYLYNLLKRNAPVRSFDLILTLAAVPWLPAAALAELVAGLAGHGGTVAVVARRV